MDETTEIPVVGPIAVDVIPSEFQIPHSKPRPPRVLYLLGLEQFAGETSGNKLVQYPKRKWYHPNGTFVMSSSVSLGLVVTLIVYTFLAQNSSECRDEHCVRFGLFPMDYIAITVWALISTGETRWGPFVAMWTFQEYVKSRLEMTEGKLKFIGEGKRECVTQLSKTNYIGHILHYRLDPITRWLDAPSQ
ncbi:hypothetical protein LA080_005769 [Diaporthe eres]|nr:hypothetical protein LA080_005769 [Diaporthe eres]